MSNNKKSVSPQPETEVQQQSKTRRQPQMLSLFLSMSVISGHNSGKNVFTICLLRGVETYSVSKTIAFYEKLCFVQKEPE